MKKDATYYEKNREKIIEATKAWKLLHKDKIKEYNKKYQGATDYQKRIDYVVELLIDYENNKANEKRN